jgi:signal transduction histidine kinase
VREGKPKAFALARRQDVNALAEDPSGTVWVGTEEGQLLCINGDQMVDRTLKIGDVKQTILSLHATPDGSLWIGYRTCGLGRLKDGNFFLFGKEQGLQEKGISEIVSDGQGFLWCTSSRGLFRLKLEELASVAAGESKLSPFYCGYGEGLPDLQGSSESWPRAARSQSGELFMATGSGLAIVHPGRIRESQLPPPTVVIERVRLNGRAVALYDAYLTQSGSNASSVVDLNGLESVFSLGQGVRQLGIEFTAVSFKGYEHVKFQYRLEGLNDDWVEAGSQKAAYYSQLPPGNYRFRVKACNNEGTWNEAGAALDLTVTPFFWQTGWFLALAGVLSLVAVAGSVRAAVVRRMRQKLEQLRQRHALEAERARIARDIHDDLGARLTKISLLSSLTERDLKDPRKAAEHINEISGAVREVTTSLDEVVWAVEPKNDTLDNLATYLCRYTEEFLGGTAVRCRLKVPSILPSVTLPSTVRHDVFMVVKEALNNVAKHAQAATAWLSLSFESRRLTISVEDDGSGFDAATVERGNGLENMSTRLGRLGGEIRFENRPDGGSRVVFSIPL